MKLDRGSCFFPVCYRATSKNASWRCRKFVFVAVGADRTVCGGDKGVVKVWNFSQALEIKKRPQALRGIRLENRMTHKKVHTEMDGENGRLDQSMVASTKNGIWITGFSHAISEASDSWLAYKDRLLTPTKREMEKPFLEERICKLADIHYIAIDAAEKDSKFFRYNMQTFMGS